MINNEELALFIINSLNKPKNNMKKYTPSFFNLAHNKIDFDAEAKVIPSFDFALINFLNVTTINEINLSTITYKKKEMKTHSQGLDLKNILIKENIDEFKLNDENINISFRSQQVTYLDTKESEDVILSERKEVRPKIQTFRKIQQNPNIFDIKEDVIYIKEEKNEEPVVLKSAKQELKYVYDEYITVVIGIKRTSIDSNNPITEIIPINPIDSMVILSDKESFLLKYKSKFHNLSFFGIQQAFSFSLLSITKANDLCVVQNKMIENVEIINNNIVNNEFPKIINFGERSRIFYLLKYIIKRIWDRYKFKTLYVNIKIWEKMIKNERIFKAMKKSIH